MFKTWEAIDTEKTVMSTVEYAEYLSALTGNSYTSNDITYRCRTNKLPSNAKAFKDENSSLWRIAVKNTQVPKKQYIELANKYNELLSIVKAAGGILEKFLANEEIQNGNS